MAGASSEDSGIGWSVEGNSSGPISLSGEALAEWRSSEQVENGTPSTSPPYWDSDGDDDGGPKPCDLYGKYTWKIENFSQINKRELRSNAFEVGGYKWYILIYPQGCDVCNHLSLFLCVANHDKLLPGWSHFAQFTIAVVNKDPKKSKYSDTLHRFCKKEHDWGWKKFMELSKVLDGFIDSDSLIIKAQVQVIREKVDRPFRCLDCQYRRELVRVYLGNVEQNCRRFVEERRSKLGKLIDDKARWSSFCSFWLGIEQNARRRMSREKMDAVLKVVVKHFFIEKEVTSTLVMDSLYSGLKALEGQTKCKQNKLKLLDAEESPAPIVRIEKDMFVLVDDVLKLLERAAVEPLPPKDDKGPQTRIKDGNSGEDFNKESIERDERRLTELGRRTVEIFVLAHIFSNKIEVAYHESVALKRQEELIREEDEAWQAETDQKAKRGATEKEKKSKKKQAKQKRNNRKGKDKGREERPDITIQERLKLPIEELKVYTIDELKAYTRNEEQLVVKKGNAVEDVSDVSDSMDGVAEVPQPESEDRDASLVSWDTDTSEILPPTEPSSSGIGGLSSVQNGVPGKKSPSVMDDSSSTCSTDSLPSVVMNGPYKGNSFSSCKTQKSSSRGKQQRGKSTSDGNFWPNEMNNRSPGAVVDAGNQNDVSGSCSKVAESESEPAVHSLQDRKKCLEQNVVKKEEEVVSLKKKTSNKDQVDLGRLMKEKKPVLTTSPESPFKIVASTGRPKPESQGSASTDSIPLKKVTSVSVQQTDRVAPLTASSQSNDMFRPDNPKAAVPKLAEKGMAPVAVVSRPSSAPLVPGPRPPTSTVVSMAQTSPLLSRSMSAAGRLGPDPSLETQSFVPQSYRNAILGNHVPVGSTGLTHTSSPSPNVKSSPSYSQPPPALVSSPMFIPQSPEVMDANTIKSGFPFGMITQDVLHNGPQWMESSRRESSNGRNYDHSSMLNDRNFNLYKPLHGAQREQFPIEFPAGTSGCQTQGVSATEDFPHIDIINDLLDDEHGFGGSRVSSAFFSYSNGSNHLNRQYSYPGDMGTSSSMESATSSCRFERTRSYQDDGFQRSYMLGGYQEFTPQAGTLPYVNGQIDLTHQNQWQVGGSDPSLQGMRSTDTDRFPYYNPDYSSTNGYTIPAFKWSVKTNHEEVRIPQISGVTARCNNVSEEIIGSFTFGVRL